MALARSKRTPRDVQVLADVADRLYDLRDECGLSPRDVAQHLSVSVASVLAWEGGRVAFDILVLWRLARLYQCSPEFLVTGHEPRQDRTNPWAAIGPAFGEDVWPDKTTAQEERALVPTAHRAWYEVKGD